MIFIFLLINWIKILDLDAVKLASNSEFIKTHNSLAIDLNSSNLPSGSYDNIFIKCGAKENKCDVLTYNLKCICNSLVGGTGYSIKFITRKKDWNDEVIQFPIPQFTSN